MLTVHRNFKIKAQTVSLSLRILMSTYSNNYSGCNICNKNGQILKIKWTLLSWHNRVQEEHVQIINLINTRGAQSVINPVNKVRGVYIHSRLTSVSWQFPSIPQPPLLRTYNYLCPNLRVLWVQSSYLGALPSDSTLNMHNIYSIYYM